jgi:signal transduction histidine kinase
MLIDPAARSRDLLPAITGLALFMLAWLAFDSIATRNEEVRAAIVADVRSQISAQLATWEREIETDLDEMLTIAAGRDDALSRPVRAFRRNHPWFDSLYVWTEPAGGPQRLVLSYPSATDMPDTWTEPPCVLDARRRAAGDASPRALADALIAACADAKGGAHAYAMAEAAAPLRSAGFSAEALDLLAQDEAYDRPPLMNRSRGDPYDPPAPIRLNRWLLLAAVHQDLGNDEAARRLLEQTVTEVTDLQAPHLELTLRQAQFAVDELEAAGRQVPALRDRLEVALERLAAWRDLLRHRDRSPPASSATVGARFLYDPDADHPHVLYLIDPAADHPGIALHLRPDMLLRDFVAHHLSRFASDVVITTRAGDVLMGDSSDEVEEGTEVEIPAALRGLRVGLRKRAIDHRVAPLQDAALTWRNLVLVVAIVLGYGALWAFARADREHRALLRRQRDFTARVTHELKTPLAGIKVMAEMLSIGAFKTDQQRADMADRIVAEADRLTSRVDEILQVAKARVEPAPERFDVEEPVMACIEAWGPRYEQRGVALIAELDPIDPLLGHPDALRDAVSCLLDNALKYRREDIASKVWLTVREDGPWAEIEVLDNGIGVPPRDRKEIFKPYVRVEGDHRGKAGGHGLGLSQVADIVALHKGSVSCEEGVDGGARFVIRLPVPAV